MAKGTDVRPRGPGRTTSPPPVDRNLGGTGGTTWALSPTDLTFLWDECPRCFYNKVVLGRSRPRSPFPTVFGRIDRAMKDYYLGRRSEEVVSGTPPGVIEAGDRWVKSAPIGFPTSRSSLIIRGRIDALVTCDDGTTVVIDFKTSEPNGPHLDRCARQLNAYACALEHPATAAPLQIDALGLVVFAPLDFACVGGEGALSGEVRWVAVDLDRGAFSDFLADVGSTLDLPGGPPATPGCQWCTSLDRCAA